MRTFKLTLLASAATFSAVAASPTMAQSAKPKNTAAQPTTPSAAKPDDPSTPTVQDIIVTGSRIQNAGTQSPTPLTVVDAAKMLQTAPSSVDDVINQLPAFRASSGPNQVQRNAGSTSTGQSLANLRGLGAQRTLVLIDGRRPVPTNPQATTSTSIIPVGLIKRMEVVTGGASAAYGSDAVGGVANFVLLDRLEGIHGSIYSGISQQGDNKEFGGNLSFGLNLAEDRLHIVAGADYNKNYGVGNIYTRDWSAVEPGNSGNPLAFGATRAAGTAAFGWANGVEYATQTPGGVITGATTTGGAASSALNLLAFNPDGSTYTLARGPVLGNLMINSSSNRGAGPLSQWNLKQPMEQFAGMVRLSYDLSDNVKAFADINYARSNVFTFSQYHQSPTITIMADNPYLPAGIKAQMAAGNIASFNMGRIDTDWLGTSANNTYTTFQLATGFKGKIFDRFNWDATYIYGRSTIDSQVYGTREANLYAALYAVKDSSGNIVCGPIASNPGFAANRLTNSVQMANVQSGCVPMNPFGAGNVSQAAKDYVSGIEYTMNYMVRHDAALNISGPLFRLPGGDVSAAVGAEFRRDTLTQTADAAQIQGLYSSGNNKSYGGAATVKEFYGELELPLLKDITGIRSLSANGAVRRTDYNLSGAVTTWKVGGVYEPVQGLRFRATRSRDIRAPSLSELFLVGGVSATGSFVNPFNGQSARLPQQTVGNPNLKPEKADTFSAGVAYQGHGALGGLRFSVDYYNIKVKDVIASVAATDVLARCYAGLTSYCSAITFDSSAFGISKVFVQPFNQSLLQTQGIDLEAGYRTSLERIGLPGSIDATLFVNNLMHYKSTDIAGPNGVTLDYAGYQNASSKWNWTAYINYRIKAFNIGLQMRAFSSIKYSPLYKGPGEAGYDPAASNSISKNTFEGQALFNLNMGYDFDMRGSKAQFFINISNLFDKNPPQYAIAAINLGGNPYDYVGRSFKVGMRFGL
ncbi:TonB-dependent receptor plug domain-containing protein [Novosphingobium sp. KACC 22771]|uniref:TonB-dependent receptor plug domain-containing protein n=1 Tax=Novosphingobium sp. KACC 22771 TaxID=3025670 RepID=UPI002365C6DF|nr:TonB-dependent receptor [Novosphingobium sp. KACC 22771]WDF75144.1 TonB-dependent receptor [Novosphingobium sp. KACC 22771]